MREITTNEVKDPVQLRRYLSELGRMLQQQQQQQFQPVPPTIINQSQPAPLPDQLLADLQLTQVPRVYNYNATAAPTTEDNAAKGYTAGSRWYVPSVPEIYECVYSDNSTATWVQVY